MLKESLFTEIYINKQTTDEFCTAQSMSEIHSHYLHCNNAASVPIVMKQLQLQAYSFTLEDQRIEGETIVTI